MTVIQLEVEETLIEALGTRAVKQFVERQLAQLRLQHLGDKIAETIRQSNVRHEVELDEARQEAWQEYRSAHMKDPV